MQKIASALEGEEKINDKFAQALYSQADKAIFLAKEQGRNKVVISNISKQKKQTIGDRGVIPDLLIKNREKGRLKCATFKA